MPPSQANQVRPPALYPPFDLRGQSRRGAGRRHRISIQVLVGGTGLNRPGLHEDSKKFDFEREHHGPALCVRQPESPGGGISASDAYTSESGDHPLEGGRPWEEAGSVRPATWGGRGIRTAVPQIHPADQGHYDRAPDEIHPSGSAPYTPGSDGRGRRVGSGRQLVSPGRHRFYSLRRSEARNSSHVLLPTARSGARLAPARIAAAAFPGIGMWTIGRCLPVASR